VLTGNRAFEAHSLPSPKCDLIDPGERLIRALVDPGMTYAKTDHHFNHW
jgi:hypothetical protein